MKHTIVILIAILCTFAACRTKTVTPEPEPDEYFSFYADGEYFNYPQKKGLGFTGDGQLLEAYKVGGTGYNITARMENVPRGMVMFSFPGAHIPDRDTIILDGGFFDATIYDIKEMSNNYTLQSPLKGKIIFTERTTSRLTGTFEFQAFKFVSTTGALTDTVITITGGKFSIIPKN